MATGVLRPFKVWSCDRQTRKAVVVSSLEELKVKGSEKLGYGDADELTIVLESDGTEVEDDLYYNTLDNGTVFLLLQPSEKWSPTQPMQQLGINPYGVPVQFIGVSPMPPAVNTTGKGTRKEIPIAPKPGLPHIVRPFASPSRETSLLRSHDAEELISLNSRTRTKRRKALRKHPLNLIAEHDYYVEPKKSRFASLIKDELALLNETASIDIALNPEPLLVGSVLDCRGYWSYLATKQLIRLYMEFRPQFRSNLFKVTDIWKLIARRMNAAGYSVSYQLCDKKWRNLKISYRGILEKVNRGAIRSRKSWQYFGLMREALSDKPKETLVEDESESSNDHETPDWLTELFELKKEQQARELEEIQLVHEHSIEQLRKENESLHLLNEYLASCSKTT